MRSLVRKILGDQPSKCKKVEAALEKNKAAKENLKHKVSDSVSIAIMGFKDGMGKQDGKNAG